MENFDFYKEFEKSYEERLSFSKSFLDSVLYNLSAQEQKLLVNNNENEALKIEYFKNRDQYINIKEEHATSLDNYYSTEMEKITLRLNKYFLDYGRDHKYQYIMGAGGQGVLLYADSTLNITDQFIKYANERYAGIK